jgi:hypothetical protein
MIAGVVAVGLWFVLRDRPGGDAPLNPIAAASRVGAVTSADVAAPLDPRSLAGSARGVTIIAASRRVKSTGDAANASTAQLGVKGSEDTVLAADAAVPVDAAEPTDAIRKVPREWFRTGDNDGYTFLTDHQTVHTGVSSAVLQGREGQDDSLTGAFQACRATDFRGLQARFTIFLFGGASAEVWMRPVLMPLPSVI